MDAEKTRLADEERAKKIAVLEAIYAELPTIECKGLCFNECSFLALTELEAERVISKAKHLPVVFNRPNGRCDLLDANNRCEAYDVRPMICRLFGLEESMQCPHGCQPSRLLTAEEGNRFLSVVAELSPMYGPSMVLVNTIAKMIKGG